MNEPLSPARRGAAELFMFTGSVSVLAGLALLASLLAMP